MALIEIQITERILLYIGEMRYKCKNIYNKCMYKLSGVLRYGMCINRYVENGVQSP